MWNDSKGFGFVRPEHAASEKDDHFVHISVFKKGMSRRPEIGDEIRFRPADPSDSPDKKRIAFALVEGMSYEHPEPKRFTLIPKPRSWAINLLILTPLVLSSYLLWLAKNPLPFFSYAILSLITILIYGADKTQAATHQGRIPEGYLLLLELMGGWPGALVAQDQLRHKTRKSLYKVLMYLIIAAHLLGWFIYLYWGFHLGRP